MKTMIRSRGAAHALSVLLAALVLLALLPMTAAPVRADGTGGTVKNLTLADTHITGNVNAGGVAGVNKGVVSGCTVAADVCVAASSTGGTITGNTANQYSGGVYVNSGSFRVSGSPVVTGNTRGTGGQADNVYLKDGMVITASGALTESASIGVAMRTPGVFTSGLSGRGAEANSTSDDASCAVDINADGEAYLVRLTTYAVTVNGGTGGGSYAEGASVTVTANAPEAGKRFKEWTGAEGLSFTDGGATSATATFTMPAQAVTLTATYEDIPITTWAVTVADGITGGTVTASPAAAEGATVTLTVTPASGYVIGTVRYNDGSDHEITPTGDVYSFTMPASDVTVSATFTRQYQVWVGGVQVSDRNKNDVLGDGKVSYTPTVDPDTNAVTGGTLTFTDCPSFPGAYTAYGQNALVHATAYPLTVNLPAGGLTVEANGKDAFATSGVDLTVNGNLTTNGAGRTFYYDGDGEKAAEAVIQPVFGINVSDAGGGTVAVDGARPVGTGCKAPQDAAITLTVTPEPGCVLNSLTVTDADHNPVAVSGNTFTMPAADVTVTAAFAAVSVEGRIQGDRLCVTGVSAPDDATVIAAVYNGSGRLARVKTVAVRDIASFPYDTGLAVESGETCKLMLVEAGSFAPLCGAWSGTA